MKLELYRHGARAVRLSSSDLAGVRNRREGGALRRLAPSSAAVFGMAAALASAGLGCSDGHDTTELLEPQVAGASSEVEAFLGLPLTREESANSPELLSQTGAFAELTTLRVREGILPYSVQAPLWSDGARKQRWMALPTGSQIGFSASGPWSFPEGTVFIKHFGMALDERSPEQVTRLETRFLVAARDGDYYGLVYRWDEDQLDARLLLDGADEELEIVQEDGSVRVQRYSYPSQSACDACHSQASGFVMGPRTAQLNGEDEDGVNGRGAGNQLAAWSSLGLFDTPLAEEPQQAYPRLAPLADETAALELRVRSYWDANCSACHNAESPIRSWDARFSTPLAQQKVLLEEPQFGPRLDGVRLITPGDPERSLLYLRSASAQPGMRMPPLLRNRVDERYVVLLAEWIRSLPPR